MEDVIIYAMFILGTYASIQMYVCKIGQEEHICRPIIMEQLKTETKSGTRWTPI